MRLPCLETWHFACGWSGRLATVYHWTFVPRYTLSTFQNVLKTHLSHILTAVTNCFAENDQLHI